MKNVMTRAWEIARKGAAKFGGKVKEYFAQALRLAWEEIKGGTDMKDVYVQSRNEAKEFFSKCLDMFIAKKFVVANRTAETAIVTDPTGKTRKVFFDVSGSAQTTSTTMAFEVRVLASEGTKIIKLASKTLKIDIA